MYTYSLTSLRKGMILNKDSRNVVFTIISQPEPHHASKAAVLKQDIESQVMQLEKPEPHHASMAASLKQDIESQVMQLENPEPRHASMAAVLKQDIESQVMQLEKPEPHHASMAASLKQDIESQVMQLEKSEPHHASMAAGLKQNIDSQVMQLEKSKPHHASMAAGLKQDIDSQVMQLEKSEPHHASMAAGLKQDIDSQVMQLEKSEPHHASMAAGLKQDIDSQVMQLEKSEPHHTSMAAGLKQDIASQVMQIEKRLPNLHLTHEEFPFPGAWAIRPLLGPLNATHAGGDVRWVFFLEAHTAVRCDKLFAALEAADKQEDTMWIGYPLSDEEPTIIHHFEIFEELEEKGGFVYPNVASGFAMRLKLIETLLKQIKRGIRELPTYWTIDPGYELAKLVYGDARDPGPLLTPDLSFCMVSGDNCATYPKQFETCVIKTWSGFHETRAGVVKRTWGQHVTNLQFYSDKDGYDYITGGGGTVFSVRAAESQSRCVCVGLSVPDDMTLCYDYITGGGGTVFIVRAAESQSRCVCVGLSVPDDMTLCYDYITGGGGTVFSVRAAESQSRCVCVGLSVPDDMTLCYDYITGGGGTVFSVRAAESQSRCVCVGLSVPDDMTLGECATHRHNVSVTHSSLFHQARPQDYAREVLAQDRPVSFHRHSSPGPLKSGWRKEINLKNQLSVEITGVNSSIGEKQNKYLIREINNGILPWYNANSDKP
ncbi:putative Beta-1,3-glucosyltransferase [Operophtera brumata]|uniref:Putative Beta-1,3-glucosyltransferase n=1 Tax=Operophtera brumata TaxID=104452 RepID=A0A0L7LNF4_OPEBR|nr:putative Beta-1,3-glucosyltransferase [Operophtera brumata]